MGLGGLQGLRCFLVLGFAVALHRVDDDGDEQVQHGEGGDQDEGDEEGPGIGELLHHRAGDAHGPAFQGHDLKQGVEGTADGAEPLRIGGREQVGGDDGEHIVKDTQHQGDGPQPRDRRQQCAHNLAHRRHHGQQPQYPQHPQGA